MTTAERLTLEQFLCLPDTEPASEFAHGEVYQKPMPGRKHAKTQVYLAATLTDYLEAHPLGEAGTEWRCAFGRLGRERVFVPDLMFVSSTRVTADETFRGPPDLAVE